MATHLHRSIEQPIRQGLSWQETWEGPDQGLIWCWERGRQKRTEEPDLALRASNGELVELGWKGGTSEGLKMKRKFGTLKYLATWQGLRNEPLDIALDAEREVICAKTGITVIFKVGAASEDETE